MRLLGIQFSQNIVQISNALRTPVGEVRPYVLCCQQSSLSSAHGVWTLRRGRSWSHSCPEVPLALPCSTRVIFAATRTVRSLSLRDSAERLISVNVPLLFVEKIFIGSRPWHCQPQFDDSHQVWICQNCERKSFFGHNLADSRDDHRRTRGGGAAQERHDAVASLGLKWRPCTRHQLFGSLGT